MQQINYSKLYSFLFRVLLFFPIGLLIGRGMCLLMLSCDHHEELVWLSGVVGILLASLGFLDKLFEKFQLIDIKYIKWIYAMYAILYGASSPLIVLVHYFLAFLFADFIYFKLLSQRSEEGIFHLQAKKWARFTTIILLLNFLLILISRMRTIDFNPALMNIAQNLSKIISLEYQVLSIILVLLFLFIQWYFTFSTVKGMHHKLFGQQSKTK